MIGALAAVASIAGYAQVTPADDSPVGAAAASGASRAALRAENRALQKAVLHSLAKTKGLDSSNIVVVARSKVVTLNGSVPSADQVELAIAAARRVSGVSDVKSNLDVRAEGA